MNTNDHHASRHPTGLRLRKRTASAATAAADSGDPGPPSWRRESLRFPGGCARASRTALMWSRGRWVHAIRHYGRCAWSGVSKYWASVAASHTRPLHSYTTPGAPTSACRAVRRAPGRRRCMSDCPALACLFSVMRHSGSAANTALTATRLPQGAPGGDQERQPRAGLFGGRACGSKMSRTMPGRDAEPLTA